VMLIAVTFSEEIADSFNTVELIVIGSLDEGGNLGINRSIRGS